jgi:hypothetical protein
MPKSGLWGGIDLPVWNEDSPQELYALFEQYQAGGLSAAALDRYARWLMVFTSMHFRAKNRRTLISLKHANLDEQAVAADVVAHLVRKSRSAIRLKSPCWRVLLAVLNTSIRNYVMTLVHRRQCRDVRFEDAYAEESRRQAIDFNAWEPDLLERVKAAEDEIVGDLLICPPTSLAAIEALFELLAEGICRGELVSYCRLDTELQQEVPPELHAIVAARLNRFVTKALE